MTELRMPRHLGRFRYATEDTESSDLFCSWIDKQMACHDITMYDTALSDRIFFGTHYQWIYHLIPLSLLYQAKKVDCI